MDTLVVNLFGGPCSGKSTTCASIFARLKKMGVNAEMALEYAKDLVRDEAYEILADQELVFKVQLKRVRRLVGKVDVVITDGPLLHSIIYNMNRVPELDTEVLAAHRELTNLNVFLRRPPVFHSEGRVHTEMQSKILDDKILRMLAEYEPNVEMVGADEKTEDTLLALILKRIPR